MRMCKILCNPSKMPHVHKNRKTISFFKTLCQKRSFSIFCHRFLLALYNMLDDTDVDFQHARRFSERFRDQLPNRQTRVCSGKDYLKFFHCLSKFKFQSVLHCSPMSKHFFSELKQWNHLFHVSIHLLCYPLRKALHLSKINTHCDGIKFNTNWVKDQIRNQHSVKLPT